MYPLRQIVSNKIILVFWLGLVVSGKTLGESRLIYSISGVDDTLKKNIGLHLQSLPEIEPADFFLYRDNITEKVQQALEPLGFYSSVIKLSKEADKPDTVDVQVNPGQPVILNSVQIAIEGEARNSARFKGLLVKYPLDKGTVFTHQNYESLKQAFITHAQLTGYFDAKWEVSAADVYPNKYIADIHLIFDSGARYRFGELQLNDIPAATHDLVRSMVGFEPGSSYDAVKLVKLYNDLSATNYFRQVDVHPRKDAAVDYQVPVSIVVTPRLNHEIETGVGFSTDEGSRVSVKWNKPWINSRGHSLSAESKISTRQIELSSSYKIPMGNPLLDFYSLQTGVQHKELEDTNSTRYSLIVNKWHKVPGSWNRNWFVRLESEHYQQGNKKDQSLLLVPGLTLNRKQVTGSINPVRGIRHDLKLEFSPGVPDGNTRFVRLWGRSKWLDTFAARHRVLARIEQGLTWVKGVDDLPPSLRFFTGGDQTIRGFEYDSISPKDENSKLTGGKYLTVASLEYNFKLVDKWWLAVFTDTGTSTNDYQDAWELGTGVGVRWITPLGPLRVDLAFAISEPGLPWRIHFSLGPEL